MSNTLKLHTNFSVNASWQVQILQAVDGLWCRVGDVDQTLVNAALVGFTAHFVHVWAFYHRVGAATSW